MKNGSLKKSPFSPPPLLRFALYVLFLGALGYTWILYREGRSRCPLNETPAPAVSRPVPVTLYVHINGAVLNPGLYSLSEGARVGELIEKAGGPAPDADLSDINLAEFLSDGQKLIVPRRGMLRRLGIGRAPPATYLRPEIIVEREED